MNRIIPFTALFFFWSPIAPRETRSISNIACFIKSFQCDRQTSIAKKEKKKNTIKVDLSFILGGMQECNS